MVALISIPAIERQRPVCLCEFKASKVYIISYRLPMRHRERPCHKQKIHPLEGQFGSRFYCYEDYVFQCDQFYLLYS